jgi:hypothetical protein
VWLEPVVTVGVGSCEESSCGGQSPDSLPGRKAGVIRSGEDVNGIKLDLRLDTCVKPSVVSTSKVGAVDLLGDVVSDQGLQSDDSLNPVSPRRGVSS